MFWLVDRVWQEPDPQVLPQDGELEQDIVDAINEITSGMPRFNAGNVEDAKRTLLSIVKAIADRPVTLADIENHGLDLLSDEEGGSDKARRYAIARTAISIVAAREARKSRVEAENLREQADTETSHAMGMDEFI
jgi:hypothetical protein